MAVSRYREKASSELVMFQCNK